MYTLPFKSKLENFMTEINQTLQTCLTVGVLAVAILILLALVALIYMLIPVSRKLFESNTMRHTLTTPIYRTATELVSAKLAEKKKEKQAEKAEKEKFTKPGRSCGHCGVRIKNDPVKGVVIEEQNYLIYDCPECKKQTALVQ
jgi:hypothetical protein